MFFLKALCGNSDPKKCPELWGVFNYYPNRSYGECGVQNGTWCTNGVNQMSSPRNRYYALCASEIGELAICQGRFTKPQSESNCYAGGVTLSDDFSNISNPLRGGKSSPSLLNLSADFFPFLFGKIEIGEKTSFWQTNLFWESI